LDLIGGTRQKKKNNKSCAETQKEKRIKVGSLVRLPSSVHEAPLTSRKNQKKSKELRLDVS